MKKILLLLLIACCIFFANAQIVSVAQSNRWETIHWYFELDSEKGTAILIAPPSGSYSFLNPGTEYLTDGVSNFFWTPSITGMTDEGNYFTAVKIPPAITGTDGKVYPVKAIAPRALAGSNVAFIHVPSSVVEIGEEAFEGCSSLVGIDRMSAYELVPESVAKLGKGVFKNCTALRRIDIGDGVETIEPETFDGCDALKHIKFGKKVKEIKCKLPSLEGAAFHSTVPPAMDYQLTAAEVWAPADCKGAYAAVFDDVKSFEVRTDQEQTLHFYTGYSRPVSFAIESAPVSGNGLDNSFFLYRAMSYGGLIPQYSEIASVLADVDLHTSVRKPLPYAAYFSDPEVAVVHGPSVFPSSDASNLQLRYTVPGDYELTIVSNDFTRASYKWKVEVRDGNPVTRMLISAPLFLAVGDKAECKLTFNEGKSTPDNTAVSWASENEGIVRVDENGVLTAVGEGTAKIIARSGDPACKEVFTTHQVSVSLSGVIPVNIPQMVALSNSITSWSQLKTEEITTEFHLAEISGADNQGIITAPSVDLNESGTAPRTPYTFPYPGKESLTVGGVKMMSSSIIDDIILIDLTGEYEARRTPLIIPGGANVIWDASVRFIDFVKIGDYAFAGSNIRYAHVSDSYVHGESKITELGDYVFAECHSFKGLPDGSAYDVVPDRITKMGRGVFKNCDNMEIMAIGDGITELPEETFDGCTSLRQVRLGAGIRAIKCSVDAKEVIVIASAVVPQLASDCTLSAPVILVPAEHIEKYRAAWGWDNIKPYGITVEGGRSKLGAYYNRPRNLKIDVNGYKTDGTCDYAYPYLIGKSDLPSYATGSERPFYSVEFDGSIASVFVPEKTGAKITFGLAAGTRTMTLVSTDITRARVDVPMSFASGTPVSGVTINETSVSTPMTVGEERSMVAAVSPSSASVKTVEWSVSDPEIAVMDSKTGKLKALKKGFVTVTATST
ncbi:MAG: leucine-rich repeat protein, partial [Paramuribaculum sp.]|nr:leucine-rich repeat protein [Paramuribaculum sp.]